MLNRAALSALCVFLFATAATAAPIYVTGNECPADPLDPTYTRQYYVTDATACVYDPASNNLQGTDAEADLYLNAAAAQPTWGTGWEGLGEDPTGFSFTVDAGNDDGTFTIGSALTSLYGQFAVAIKDGEGPKWAIFLLPAGDFSSDWGFSTSGGDLSHFVVYGTGTGFPPPPPPPPPPPAVPEPASLVLLGTGLVALARRRLK